MPKAILAIRRYPATILLAALLFLATLAITTGSLGIVGPGGGGGDDDGGSGFGGTGRSGEFGGSGFGGTGMPSPFVTVDDTRPEQTPEQEEPAPADSFVVEQMLEQAAEPLIAETPQVPESVDTPEAPIVQTADIETAAIETAPVAVETIDVVEEVPIEVAEAVEAPAAAASVTGAPITVELADRMTRVEAEDESEPGQQVVETMPVNLELEDEDSLDRSVLPERIQRPELPPFQRIRPIDRASIATPPRPQPMRI